MTNKVLLVEDDAMVREALAQTIELGGRVAVPTASYIEAKDHISPDFAGVILSDIRMPGRDGFALLDYARGLDAELPVILLTGKGDIPMAVRGMKGGAYAFLEKPCEPGELMAVLERALRQRAVVLENRRQQVASHRGDAAARLLRGSSKHAEALRTRVRMAARSQAEVLICGEPGSGTSKVADAIHQLSGDASRAFVKLAASGLDRTALAEGFEAARAGTLFLDEVAALAPGVQFALLDHLDRPTGTRLLAGTYRALEEEVREGRFNADLFYRLDIIRIRIPPLRERIEDIPVLFRHYVALACEQAGLEPPPITPELTASLMARDWPGNARALMNTAMRFAMGLELGLETAPSESNGGAPGLNERLAQLERSLLIEALSQSGGGASQAARALKLPRKTFYDKLARHGIRPEDFRSR